MAKSLDVVATSIALVEGQNVTIMPTEFHNRTSYEAEIHNWNSTPSSTRDEMSMHQDAIAKLVFNRKHLRHMAGDQGDIHIGLR